MVNRGRAAAALGFTACLLLGLSGCSDRKHPAALVGTWKAVRGRLAAHPSGGKAGTAREVTITGITLALNADGTAARSEGGASERGAWEVQGDRLVTHIARAAAKAAPEM